MSIGTAHTRVEGASKVRGAAKYAADVYPHGTLFAHMVGAPVAATCYVDHTPPVEVVELAPGITMVRGEGRPSKRLRRELERMRRLGGA